MGINLMESRGLDQKQDILLDPAYTGELERGMILVYSAAVSENGEQLVRPCEGTSTEVVAGCLWYSDPAQTSLPTIEEADVPATGPYTIVLSSAPTALNTIRAIRTDTGAAVVAVAGAPGSSQLGLTGKTLTAHSALAGLPIRITYRTGVSARQMAARGLRRSINVMGIERSFSQVTRLVRQCRLLLSNFDTSAVYDPADATNSIIRTAAGGRFTVGGSGRVFGRCFQAPILKTTPGLEQAFVGVEAHFPMSASAQVDAT